MPRSARPPRPEPDRSRPGSPRTAELQALGRLAGGAAGAVAGQARGVHAAVADRVFSALDRGGLGAPARPVRVVHDAVSAVAYTASRTLADGITRTVGGAVAAGASARDPHAGSLTESPTGRAALAAVCAVHGDRLVADRSPLAAPLRLLADVDPAAPRSVPLRLVVFVHGLGETEDAWRLHARRTPTYARRLAVDHGWTAWFARYNTGRSIEGNGAELAAALGRRLDESATPVAEIAFVGHSMGGLVACAAVRHAAPFSWAPRIRHVVSLGAPYAGAPLARALRHGSAALTRLPETRPFAAGLRSSDGIADLVTGPTARLAPGPDYRFVSASVSRDPAGLAGRLVGDLLVTRRSAWGQTSDTERLPFAADHYRHLGGATHFDLLGHPAVGELLSEWLAPQLALTA